MCARSIFIAVIIIFFAITVQWASASDAPNVTLVSPQDGNISKGNLTFFCNVSDDESIFNISLITDFTGNFSAYDSVDYLDYYEVGNDSDTLLLCHFNGNYLCEDGENGTDSGTSFDQGKVKKGVSINETDTLSYPISGNIEYDEGTIEYWIKVGFNSEAVFFSMGESYTNEIMMDFDGYFLNCDYYDYYGNPRTAAKDVSWSIGEWHHVACTWGNADDRMKIYIDGEYESQSAPFIPYSDFDGTNIYLGSASDGGYNSKSIFDEFRISETAMSESEINASYLKSVQSIKNRYVNWSLTGISDGSYKWNCESYDNESQGSFSSQNRTFHIDGTAPPEVSSISFSPNSTNLVDPGVNISFFANLTDPSNVSFVLFQWKETGEWNNETMDFSPSSGLWENGTIETEATGGIYYYRFWSNDSIGNSGFSDNYNISVGWDYTWDRIPSDLNTSYGYLNCQDCYVGTIALNNTGDDTLSFTFTSDWPLGMSYNVSNPLSLGSGQYVHINVTTDFASEDSEYVYIINITASHGSQTPSPLMLNVTGIINTYSGGPYFDNDYLSVTYSDNPYQSSNYTLSAQLTNIGNESASGVWINWTLPEGWVNVSGSARRYFPSVNGTSNGSNSVRSNITVYLPPEDASAGIQSLSVSAVSGENLTANRSVSVFVSCNGTDGICGNGCSYVTDSDCSIPSDSTNAISPGSSPIQSESIKDYDFSMFFPSRFNINRRETKNLTVTINHSVYNAFLNEVRLYLSGYPQTFISIPVGYIDSIGFNQSGKFIVEISAPIYALYKEYSLNLTVTGTFQYGAKRIDVNRTDVITLVTHKYIEDVTLNLFNTAEKAIKSMNSSGYDIHILSKLYEDMEYALDSGNYERVRELSETIVSTRDLAGVLETGISDLNVKLKEATERNYEMPDTERMLYLAKSAFHRGEYEIADERLDAAKIMYGIEIVNFGIWMFFRSYWPHLFSVFLIAGTAGFLSRKKIMARALNRKLSSLVEEERRIRNLIITLENEHFIHGRYGFNEYLNRMRGYENMIGRIAKRRIKYLRQLITKLGRKDAIRRLGKEEDLVRNRIASIQKEYFELGKIGKKYYERIMSGLQGELVDIKKMTDILESGENV